MTLSEYLGIINEIVGQRHLGTDTPTKKPFILSVTGTPDEIAMAYALVANAAEMGKFGIVPVACFFLSFRPIPTDQKLTLWVHFNPMQTKTSDSIWKSIYRAPTSKAHHHRRTTPCS